MTAVDGREPGRKSFRLFLERAVPLPDRPSLEQLRSFTWTPEFGYDARLDWAPPSEIDRCRRAATEDHPDPSRWRPLSTAHADNWAPGAYVELTAPSGFSWAGTDTCWPGAGWAGPAGAIGNCG